MFSLEFLIEGIRSLFKQLSELQGTMTFLLMMGNLYGGIAIALSIYNYIIDRIAEPSKFDITGTVSDLIDKSTKNFAIFVIAGLVIIQIIMGIIDIALGNPNIVIAGPIISILLTLYLSVLALVFFSPLILIAWISSLFNCSWATSVKSLVKRNKDKILDSLSLKGNEEELKKIYLDVSKLEYSSLDFHFVFYMVSYLNNKIKSLPFLPYNLTGEFTIEELYTVYLLPILRPETPYVFPETLEATKSLLQAILKKSKLTPPTLPAQLIIGGNIPQTITIKEKTIYGDICGIIFKATNVIIKSNSKLLTPFLPFFTNLERTVELEKALPFFEALECFPSLRFYRTEDILLQGKNLYAMFKTSK